MRSKNYSKKYHTRWLKDTDSSVAWQTGLLKVEGTFKNKTMIRLKVHIIVNTLFNPGMTGLGMIPTGSTKKYLK